ncbi:MAG: hypothetical protein JWM27_1898 [Gemmatimonadetes bacterium]|nr:hypothetical protein [Gemmatimonadota bacterium]
MGWWCARLKSVVATVPVDVRRGTRGTWREYGCGSFAASHLRSRLPLSRIAAFVRSVAGRCVLAGALVLASHADVRAQEQVAAGGVRVVFWPGQRGRAEEVLAIARQPMRLAGIGRRGAPAGTTILLAPDPAAFRRLTDDAAPEWAGGIAIPERREIVLPGWASAREPGGSVQLIRHEVAHLALNAYLGRPVPRWFDEGYAEIASGGLDAESAWKLRVAIAAGKAPPLDSLELGWPEGADRARLAYLLSATAVQYLQQRNGEHGFEVLLASWRERGTLEVALRATFGTTTGHVETEWRDWVRLHYGWMSALTSAAPIGLIITALVLLIWIPRRRKSRRILAEMAAETRMLPPHRPELVGVEYPLSEAPPPDE